MADPQTQGADIPGLLTPGNIDMSNRPRVTNPDGSISTVRSIGVNIDGKEVLIPTVVGNGVVSDADAIAEYKRTGKQLGIFDTPEHSTAFAQGLHESEAQKLQQPQTDPLTALLTKAPVGAGVRADAWDAFHSAANEDDLAAKLQKLPMPQATKAALWDLKHQGGNAAPSMNFAKVNGQDVPVDQPSSRSWLDTLADLLPTAGGTVGGIYGGNIGAAVGGAAGAGYRDIAQHANEIPGAVRDVLRNLVSQPAATAQGFVQGAGEGLKDAGISGAIQGAANVVGNVVGAGAGKAMSAVAPRLMQSALKPTKTILDQYGMSGGQLAKTLLDEGVNVTQPGLSKLQGLFTANNAEIKQALVDRNDLLGRLGLPQQVISKDTVAARALTTAGDVANQVNPNADLRAVGKTVEQFRNHPIFTGDLTLPEAQALKQGTYQQIGKKYGEVSSAGIETQKALARGLKEDIASEVPQISDLNARDSRLMAAMDAVGHRIALAGNRDPVGFAWVAHNPMTFLAALMDRQPAIKSLLARGLYNSAGVTAKVSPALIRTAVAAIAQTGSPSLGAQPPQD